MLEEENMVKIPLSAIIEIFTNPRDLQISIERKKENDKYAFAITRGPKHCFWSILASEPFAKTPEEAIGEVKKVLQEILNSFAIKEINVSEILQIRDGSVAKTDPDAFLTQGLIDRIVEKLHLHGLANTY